MNYQNFMMDHLITIICICSYLIVAIIFIIENVPDYNMNNLKRKHVLVGFTWPIWFIAVAVMVAIVPLYKFYNVLRYNDALGKTKKISQKEIQYNNTTNTMKETTYPTYEEKENIITNIIENDTTPNQ